MTKHKSKTTSIDPTALTAAALKACKCAADYHRLGTTSDEDVFKSAWNTLPADEQNRITHIINTNTQPDPQTIADEMSACGSRIELQAIKASYGDASVKSAWQLLPAAERDRLKKICYEQQAEETVTQPGGFDQQAQLQPQLSTTKASLIDLSSELKQLDNLLDSIDGDIPVDLQYAVDELLAQKEQTHEILMEKIDNYCGLIQSRLMWATARKAEADRLAKLAESDMKTVDFLKSRLKAHLEATDQKKLRTKRFNISVRTAGGKQGLRLNVENPKDLPQRFQRVIIEPNNTALREALEGDDPEAKELAFFAERTTYVAIN